MRNSERNPEAVLRRLEWTVVRRLDGLLQGDYRTLFRGFGLDLADLREYRIPDDVRKIDWNVTARLDAPYVREYHEDREITAWFLLDVSPSVDFGSETRRKRSVLIEFATVLARLLTRHGNRTGAAFYADGVSRVIPAAGGRPHVLYILGTLLSMPELPASRETELSMLLEAGARLMKRRSLVFVVSDFMSAPGWAERLAFLSLRHEVIAARVFDPLELELPDLGIVLMQDAETGEQLLVDTHDRSFRKRFSEAARERETALRSSFRDSGVDFLELSTEADLVEILLRFAERRTMMRRLASGAAFRKGGRQ